MAKNRHLKFSVQIDYDERYSKNTRLGDKRGLALVTSPTFQFWDPLNIYGMAKATNFQKLSMGMTGSQDRASIVVQGPSAVGGRVGRVVWGLFPETKHLHICQSVLLAILFKNVLRMLKINQSHSSFILPSVSLRPVTATRYQISPTF